jgi:predicted DNA-binding transcriptional regulator YafY
MSNLHRMAWLDSRIRSERYPDCRELAEKFEISVRQAQRDIEYLKYTMGAPLEYSSAEKGYYYKDKTFLLPSAMISKEEKQILSYMANRYKITGGTDARRLAGLFERLGNGTDEGSLAYRNLPIIHINSDESGHYNILSEALKLQIKVKMEYEKSNGGISNRVFHVYTLFNREQIAYVSGFCELRGEIRIFRVSRIKKLILLDENYEIPSYYNGTFFEQGTGYIFKEPYIALVETEQTPGSETPVLKIEHVDGKLYKIYFYSSDEIIAVLLSLKYSFKIKSPNWLKDKLRQKLDKIIQTNFDPT